MKESIYDYKVKDIDGNEVAMSEFKDKVLMIVNVASKCGFTPQYEGLQKLYDAYKDQGLVVLGFLAINLELKSKVARQKLKISVKPTSR